MAVSVKYDHVMVVTGVNSNGTITVDEYNYDLNGDGDVQTASPASMGISGYIYYNNVPGSTTGAGGGSAPSSPSSLSAGGDDLNDISLSWGASSGGSGGVAGYRVYRQGQLLASVYGAATTTYVDRSVIPGDALVYDVTAVDAAGDESAASPSVTVHTPQQGQGGFQLATHLGTTYCRRGGTGGSFSTQYLECTVFNGSTWSTSSSGTGIDWGYDVGWAWVSDQGNPAYCRRGGTGGSFSTQYLECTVFNGSTWSTSSSGTGIDWGYDSGTQWSSSAPPSPVNITTTTLPAAVVGAAYSTTFGGSGGTAPYTWSLIAGALPAGLTFSSAGSLAGTPTTAGTASVTVRVTDSSNPPLVATRTLTIRVLTNLAVTTTSLGSPVRGVAYAVTLASSGGVGAKSWSIAAGALPAGLTLSSAGVLSGTAAAVGTYSVTVKVTDSALPANTATKAFTITVVPIAVATMSVVSPVKGVAYSAALTASGGVGTKKWTITTGALPAGLTLSSSGVISGKATAVGSLSVTVKVTDSAAPADMATKTFTITVVAMAVTTSVLPAAVHGHAYAVTLVAAGGTGTKTWALSSGTLPAGLKLLPSGVISGTPTTAGSYTFTVKVTDTATPPNTATRALTLTIT